MVKAPIGYIKNSLFSDNGQHPEGTEDQCQSQDGNQPMAMQPSRSGGVIHFRYFHGFSIELNHFI